MVDSLINPLSVIYLPDLVTNVPVAPGKLVLTKELIIADCPELPPVIVSPGSKAFALIKLTFIILVVVIDFTKAAVAPEVPPVIISPGVNIPLTLVHNIFVEVLNVISLFV